MVNAWQAEHELYMKKLNDTYLLELEKEVANTYIPDVGQIIPVIIDMSVQFNGVINFGKKSDNLLSKPIQIYLHRLKSVDKFLSPIILTVENRDKLRFVIANLNSEGHTLNTFLDKWIKDNNIQHYVNFE
jgi:hypothetical protein